MVDIRHRHKRVVNHIRKHHKKYLVGGFGLFGAIKAMIFVLGLIPAMIGNYHVKAAMGNNIAYETSEYAGIAYVDTQGNEFEMGTITITNGTDSITILDRNLGASTNNINSPDSFGYHFQWGNNYGFANNITPQTSTTQVNVSSYGWSNPYVSNIFIKSKNWDSSNNSNLWGGASDLNNNWMENTLNQGHRRQGPCPAGYHVPSEGEWNKLMTWYWNSKGWGSYLQRNQNTLLYVIGQTSKILEFRNDLKIPFGGIRKWDDASVLYSNLANFRSSSFSLGNAYYFYFISSDRTATSTDDLAPGYGFSVRCFKNSEDENAVILSFETNGGQKIQGQTVPLNGTAHVIGYDPVRTGYIFGGWYKDDEFIEPFQFGVDTLSQDTTIYAKWIPIGEMIYQDNVTTYIDTQGNEFNMGTISYVRQNGDVVVMLDRNLGAIKKGTGLDANGYYFQWGNNYGFANNIIPTISMGLVNTNGYSWSNPYINKIFVGTTDSPFNRTTTVNNDLWGGSNDSNPDYMRQGPCPPMYHIPTKTEVESGFLGLDTIGENMNSIFLMPYGGSLFYNDARFNERGLRSMLWVTTTTSSAGMFLDFYNDINARVIGSYRSWGFSIRCFADTTPNEVILSFESNGGQKIQGQTVPLNGTAHVIGYDPVKDGYTFGGWYKDLELTQQFQFGVDVLTGDMTIYAKWIYIPKIYTVTFDSQGGTEIDSIEVEENSIFTAPVDPTKSGYAFRGRYLSGMETEWNFEIDVVTGDMILYAKWIQIGATYQNNVTTYIDTQGNEFEMGTITYTDNNGNSLTILDRNLGATESGTGENAYGYHFQWGNNYGFPSNKTPNTSSTKVNTSTYSWDNPYVSNIFITTSNGWETNTTSNLWGGNGEYDYMRQGPCPAGYHVPTLTEISTLYNLFGNNVTSINENLYIPYGGIRRYGAGAPVDYLGTNAYLWSSTIYANLSSYYYKFSKWAQPSNTVDARSYGFSVRCFADTTPNEVILSFETNGGQKIQGQSVPLNGTAHVIGYDPVKDGYTFGGWYKDEEFTQPFQFGVDVLTGDTTIYAKRDKPRCQNQGTQYSGVVWNCEEGTITVTNGTQSITMQDMNVGATEVGYGSSASTGSYGLYYQWGGMTGYEYSLTAAQAKAKGFITNNTTYSSNTSGVVERNIGPCSTGYHIPTEAEWGAVLSMLNSNGLTNVNDKISALKIPFAGYRSTTDAAMKLAGSTSNSVIDLWLANQNSNNSAYRLYASSSTMYTDTYNRANGFSIRCFQDREFQTYIVTFDSDGGTEIDSIEVEENSIFTAPVDPTKSGYAFSGWYLSGTDELWNFETDVVTGDIILYAQWNKPRCQNQGTQYSGVVWNCEEGTITVTNGTQSITMKDMNVGATEVGYGSSASTGSYGLYYQWGGMTGYTYNMTQAQVIASGFIGDNTGYSATTTGWTRDQQIQICGTGYHIPTSGEMKSIINMFTANGNNAKNFYNAFKIPFPGSRRYDGYKVFYDKIHSYTWSNSFTTSDKAWILSLDASGVSVTNQLRGSAISLRCFQDREIQTYTVTFNSDGGTEIESVEVEENSTFIDPGQPTKTGYEFNGWYISGMETERNFETDIVTGNMTLYVKWIDVTLPTFDFPNNSGYECATGIVRVNNLNDNEELSDSPISFDGINWDIVNTFDVFPKKGNDITIITGYVKDLAGNISINTSIFTFVDTGVTATGFTISGVGTGISVNWKENSNANEGDCGDFYLTAEVKTQGTKGICSISGDYIIYTPNDGEKGNDLCEISIQDMEDNNVDVIVNFTDIFSIKGILDAEFEKIDIKFEGRTQPYIQNINYNTKSGGVFVVDQKGLDSGRYTMISITNLSGSSGRYIDKSNIYLKSNSIYTISGDINDNVKINTGLSEFVNIGTPVLYMYRNSGQNNRKIGKYGSDFSLKVRVPAFQFPDTYTGTIIFTIYENE